ncbi:MAG: hypothetical protein HY303_11705, partial [Candidatus Wallbacteria bacterium]|nr:hypothetical protein [Candidatus Wallbacteria bacterium]
MRTSLPVLLLLASLVALAATGCGAGGGGGSPTPTTPGGKTAGSTGGTAFKGPFVAGSPVQIFRVSGGRQGDLIGSGTVGNNGSFNIKLNDAAYSGPLIYSVSGEFASEAAGMGTEFIAPEKPVFGFLPNYAAGTNISNVVVTPLTSLAFQLALFRGLTAVSLQAAANEIGTRFGLSDILHTVPAVPKTSGTADSQAARYGLVLAGLTEQASAKGVATAQLLANLSDDASDGTLDGVATSASFGDYSSAYFTGLLADGVDTYVRSVVGSSGPSSLTSTAQSVKLNLTRALLSIGQLGLPAVGARGQVVTATLKLTNTGGNAALLSNAIVTPSQTGLAVAASVSNATRIEPGSYAILTFTITIDTSAPGGSPSFRIQVDATDAVSAQAAGGVRTDGGILPIQEPSSLSVGNLQTPGTIVPGGSFRVLMPVTNSGGSGARIDSATLFLSQPGFVVTSDAGNSQTVAAGDSVALLFTVVVGTSVPPGTVSIDARVVARDLLTGATGVATRTGAGAIRVLSPARLSIGQVVGSGPLVPGQSIQVSVPVGNVGESVVTIQSVTLGFGSQDLTVSQLSGNPPAISPGITSLFRFRVTAGANTAGRTYTAAATVSGLDSGSNLQVSAANATAGTLVIVRPATLSIQSLGLPAAVSVGQTFTATLSVANTGESTADIGSVAVTFDNPGVNTVSGVSNPGSIQPGRTQNFRVTVLVSSSASSGPVAASVDIRAVDRLSGGNASANAASVATLNVLARAGLAPLSVLMQQLVSKGQTAVATLTVQNGGQAQASITVASLSFSDRNVTSTARSDNPRTVAGNGTAQLAFDVVVGSATPSGVVTIGATVSGRDSNSNAIVGGSIGDAGSTLVQTPGAIQVSTVIGPARLSKGQTFLASATLSSVGEAAVRLSAASLTFSIPLVTAAISSTSPLPTLGQGQSIRLRFAGTVGASAAQGPIAALLEASGKDVNSNATVRDSRAGAYAATIDTTAAVSVTSLTLSTGTVSQGQTFTAVLALSNSGSATAIVTGIAVQFLQAGFVTTTAAPVPITIAGGGSVNATFQIRATTTASGSGTVTMSPTGRDANSGKPLTVAPATSNLLVQTPSRLRVSSLSFSRPTATLTQGQSASITMTLVNDGQAPADVSTVQLVFDPRVISTAGQAANVRIASTPRTFVFAVTASPTQTAVVKIDGDATAIDSNSRASLAVTRGSTLTIVVQRPAALTLDRIDVRRTVTLGQVTPASMVFRNSGEATLTLTQAVVVRNLPFVNLTTFTGLVSIPGGAAVSVTVNMTAVTSGATTLTSATAQAREDNTGRRLTVVNGMALPPTVNVQVAPGIRLEKPLVPKFVSLGQTFSVTAMVANTGEAPLRLIGASIAFRPTNLPSSLRTNLNSLTILGFSTSPVVFNVTVPVTTTAGPFDMDVSATGQDDNTGPPPLP